MNTLDKLKEYLRLQNSGKVPSVQAADAAGLAGEQPIAPKPLATTEAPVQIPETNTMAPAVPAQAPEPTDLLTRLLSQRNQKPLTEVNLTPNSDIKSSEPELLEAQQASEDAKSQARLMGAVDMTSRAIMGAKPNEQAQAMYKGMEADAETPLKQFQQKLAIRDKDVAAQQDDPKSEISQMYRLALAKSIPGVDFSKLENLSANQIGKILPGIKGVAGNELEDMIRLIRLQQGDERLGQGIRKLDQADKRAGNLEKHRDWTRIQKDELSDKQVEAIDQLDQVTGGLDEMEELKPAFDTGPIAGRVMAWRQSFGNDDAKTTAFKAKIGRQLANYVRSMSGLAVTDQERQFLSTLVPSERDQDESFFTKLNDMRDESMRIRSRKLENFRRQGKNPDQFIEKNKGINNELAKDSDEEAAKKRQARIAELKAKAGK